MNASPALSENSKVSETAASKIDGAPAPVEVELPASVVYGTTATVGVEALTPGPGVTTDQNVVVVVLAQIKKSSLLWGAGRFVFSRFALANIPGLKFSKMLGCGYDGGFGLRPSLTRQGLFLVFNTAEQAGEFLDRSPIIKQYQYRCKEFLTVVLNPYSVKGTWSGMSLATTQKAPAADHAIATLTRASIRPRRMFSFWRLAPATHDALFAANGCLLAIGVGEAPFVRQATISLWENTAAMNNYAQHGAHLTAIKAAYKEDYFSESMFVRFVVQDIKGVYKGKTFG